MGSGGVVPCECVARSSSAGARLGEFVRISEQQANGSRQARYIARGHDAAGPECADDLPESPDVVHDCGYTCAERLQERPRLVELGAVRECRDRCCTESEFDLGLAQVAEPPFGPTVRCGTQSVEGDASVSRDEESRTRDGEHGLDGIRKALVLPDHAERQHRLTVVCARRIAPEDRVGDDAQLFFGYAESGEGAAAALAVHDDAIEAMEQASPGPRVVGRPTGQQVVGCEHERRSCS